MAMRRWTGGGSVSVRGGCPIGGVSEGVEAVQVLVKNESVDVKVCEDAHKGVGWLEGVYFGPKRLVCRDVGSG